MARTAAAENLAAGGQGIEVQRTNMRKYKGRLQKAAWNFLPGAAQAALAARTTSENTCGSRTARSASVLRFR